jgi:hypothetical protein
MLLTLQETAARHRLQSKTLYNKLTNKKTREATIRELGGVKVVGGHWRIPEERIDAILRNGAADWTLQVQFKLLFPK